MATWFDNLGSWLNKGFHRSTRENNGLGNFLNGIDNLWNKITGAGLTGAEREANEYSARQAELAFERESEFYEKNQSMSAQIAAQREAGINPFGINGSASAGPVVNSYAPSSVSPTGSQGFDPIALAMQVAQFQLQKRATEAQIGKTNAETRNIETRLSWDAASFETNLSLLKQRFEAGELDLKEKRYNIDHMLPLLKEQLQKQNNLTEEQANLVYQQAEVAFNRAEKLAQEVQENRESWDDRKLSIASKAIIDDFEASAAKVVASVGNGDSLEGDALLGSLISLLKYFVVKK